MKVIIALMVVWMSLGLGEERIGVIGGGIGGVTAAYRLHKMGCDVVLFEAQERLGGRILTERIGKQVVELGGENIADGGRAPHIRELACELGLTLVENQLSMKQAYWDEEELIPDVALYKGKFPPGALEERLTVLQSSCQSMDDVLVALFPDKGLEYEVLSTKLEAYEGGPANRLSTRYVDTLKAMLLGGLSAAHAIDEKETWIDFVTVNGGNGRLVEEMGRRLGDRIHLGRPLKGVYRGEERRYALCFEEESVEVDRLVLAIPCKAYGDIDFEQGIIPQERLEQFADVPYGTNAKVLVPVLIAPTLPIKLIYKGTITFFNPSQTILTLYMRGAQGSFMRNEVEGIAKEHHPVLLAYGLEDCCLGGVTGYSWVKDPFIGGSYSFIEAGREKMWSDFTEVGGELFRTLFSPIEKTLYFVGEHTAIEEPLGTMEGACASGEKVARLIGQAIDH